MPAMGRDRCPQARRRECPSVVPWDPLLCPFVYTGIFKVNVPARRGGRRGSAAASSAPPGRCQRRRQLPRATPSWPEPTRVPVRRSRDPRRPNLSSSHSDAQDRRSGLQGVLKVMWRTAALCDSGLRGHSERSMFSQTRNHCNCTSPPRGTRRGKGSDRCSRARNGAGVKRGRFPGASSMDAMDQTRMTASR